MRSFTFNFKKKPRTVRAIVSFTITFLIAIGGGIVISDLFPSQSWRGHFPSVSADDHYMILEAYSDQAPDLYAEYFGIGCLIKEARKADILILGNSKAFFGFRNSAVRDFAKSTGLKIFNLSIPSGDGVSMAELLLDRNHLSPPILIINENHFFKASLSPYSNETIRLNYGQAWSRIFENDISWFFRLKLHPIFPKFGLGNIYGSVPVVVYRSTDNGCLSMDNFPHDLVPVADKNFSEETLTPEEQAAGIAFKKKMEARGSKIILTNVPYGTDEMKNLGKWVSDPEKRALVSIAEQPFEKINKTAALLGLSRVTPPVDGLLTFDGRHLDEASGLKFTRAFFNELIKNNSVQRILRNPTAK